MSALDYSRCINRSCYCGDLRVEDVGKEVILMGWVNRRRDHGNIIFIDLKDREGNIQLILNSKITHKFYIYSEKIKPQYIIGIKGIVQLRPEEMENFEIKTGKIEVVVLDLKIINDSITPPFQISSNKNDFITENIRLKYRYLDLRTNKLQKNLILRSKINMETRIFLNQHGFLDIETPFLTKSTPEGARDYLIPSRINQGLFYALPQSPQLFKQLLMIAGFDRYFQIIKCFRDEDLRSNRQPEFTQIDIEMSFVNEEDIFNIMEKLIQHIFYKGINYNISLPLPRLSYQEAINKYGSDKPDLRFDLELFDVTNFLRLTKFKIFRETINNGGIIKCIKINTEQSLSRKDLDSLNDFVKIYGAKGLFWIKQINLNTWHSPIAQFFTIEEIKQINKHLKILNNDLILLIADTAAIVNYSLGNLRNYLSKKFNIVNKNQFSFCWITDFPLFEYNSLTKKIVSMHHPFTAPAYQDVDLLYNNINNHELLKVKARAYDLILNGMELGGGSIRINHYNLQKKIFELLNLSQDEIKSKFGFFLEALKFGTPPHGGIAFGFDRLIMMMVNTDSIKDVIAFPKTQTASCLMTDSPSKVDLKQLFELSLQIKTT